MALVITLILLSVTLVMAVAFLSISRREREAVTTTTDAASARLAADAALANAEAQVVVNTLVTNVAAYNYGLLVSTNYINGFGFVPGVANPTNVNFDAKSDGSAFSAGDFIQDYANLFYLPRAPVFLTNFVFHAMENRFYLDLNRNGRFDTNGWVTNVDNNGAGLGTTNFEVGDPEWIGVLDHPDAPHGPNNRFVARYAFIAVPVGNTLDLNAIHNQVLNEPSAQAPRPVSVNPGTPFSDGFFRNEGVGSWEINLAAFLADLNTNQWGQVVGSGPGAPVGSANFYQYDQVNGLANSGVAFDDARALLAYRYANDYLSLASVDNLYGGPLLGSGYNAFVSDGIDGYSDGILMTGFQLPGDVISPSANDDPSKPWAGADNTNQFFQPEELFDTNKTEINAAYPGFADHLLAAGTNTFGGSTVPTYDRYTFYRMLDQLGSDSTPESGKININYSNAVVQTDINGIATNITIVPNAETNFEAWSPTNFFMAAADRLLRIYTTNWFQGSSFDYYTNYTTVTNWVYVDPSNYLATYYGIHTNYFSYIDAQGRYIWNAPNGFGMTNIPFFGMTNQIPGFGVMNIPVMINTNFVYTPAVNRLLQLAANIYDAVYYTSNYFASVNPGSYPGAYLPNVFRPIFNVTNEINYNGVSSKDVYIYEFREVTDVYTAPDAPLSMPFNLFNPFVWDSLKPGIHNLLIPPTLPDNFGTINVFGVPMIIGAKKGFPNFNEFYMENAFQLTRKLMVTRQSTNVPAPAPPPSSGFFTYYEMFNLSLSNQFGVECWNSYPSNYTRPIDIYVTNFLFMTLTNDENFSYTTNLTAGNLLSFGPSTITNVLWPGYTNSATVLSPGSFQVPLETNFAAIPVSMYRFNGGAPFLTTNLDLTYEANIAGLGFGQFPNPHWGMTLTNNLQVAMVDHDTGRLIDYVQLSGPYSVRDLTAEILRGYDTDPNDYYKDLWDTNLYNGTIPLGYAAQFSISQGKGTPTSWTVPDDKTTYDSINGFRKFTMGSSALIVAPLNDPDYKPDQNVIGAAEMTNAMQMPYTPTAPVVQDIVWQANDPLVHYLSTDLNNPNASTNLTYLNWPGNLGKLNARYQPWGGNPDTGVGTNLLAIKDPLVTCSDDWNFPTNKFPTVGWLGRVHRGTPWQTIYLKAADVLSYPNDFGIYGSSGPNLWMNWTGDVNTNDSVDNAPKKDWLLFDIFTTAFNDNATRGQLSVNVAADKPDQMAGLAAWSALFSGLVVPTSYTIINPSGPSGINSAMGQIVQGIYNTRTNFTNPDGVKGVFEHVGYILSVTNLTVESPFLAWTNAVQQQVGINDEMYEWLPQQVMSLLRDGPPRYVIYCYGQALKPAPDSLVTSSGANFGLCTNYQVVAESAARAVVRVEGAGTSAPHVVVESFHPLPPD